MNLTYRVFQHHPSSVIRTAIKNCHSLIEAVAQQLWQVPFPDGMIRATKTFDLQIEAPGWQVTSLAFVGDQILDLHLKRYRV